MSSSHKFGGNWTEEKLERIRKYLSAYTKIFTGNLGASFFTTYYVDAFAGTGYRDPEDEKDKKAEENTQTPLLEASKMLESDAESLKKGSARVALEIEPSFDNYVFIEKQADFIASLNDLKTEFPDKKISLLQGDANKSLKAWIEERNWSKSRAVVFLDPYGMHVDWSTIKTIGETKAIDLWILFPLAQAVNRLLTKDKLPMDSWSAKLDKFFGIDDWREAFYRRSKNEQLSLFGNEDITYKKEADFDAIGKYFVKRLKTVFAKVADNPLPLFNSRNSPLFLLCFASANPKGSKTAVKIAQDILSR